MGTPDQLGFFGLTHRYDALTAKGDPLEQLAQYIPWACFRKTLEKSLHRSKRSKGGRPQFDAILMFKIFVLQALYNLSDDQTDYQIRDRLSFMRFLGLDLHQRIRRRDHRLWHWRHPDDRGFRGRPAILPGMPGWIGAPARTPRRQRSRARLVREPGHS